MNKTKKIVLVATLLVISLAGILYVARIINNNTYSSQLPSLPDFTALSKPIQEQLSEAQKKAMGNPSSDNIGGLGMAYHSNALYDQAAVCYRIAIKRDPSKWIWSYYLGYLDQEMGDSKGTIENFNTVIRENPKALQAWLYLGLAYQNIGQGEKAEEAFNKIINATGTTSNTKSIRTTYTPLPISAKFELARLYISKNRMDEAEKILLGIIEKNHTIGPIYRLLGTVYRTKGDSVLSQKYIERASDLAQVTTTNDTLIDRLAMNSRSDQYLPKQIEEALKSANPEWAMQLFSHAFQYIPDNKYLISKFIKYLLRMDKAKDALNYIDKHFAAFKDDPKEMVAMGDQLYTYSSYDQAITYYEQARKLHSSNNELIVNLAFCYWKTGQKEPALSLMNELVEKNRTDPAVLASEVDFMFKAGLEDKAKSYLSTLRQIAPTYPKTLKWRGLVAETEGNTTEAVSLYEASFKGDPMDMEVITKLGNILIDKRDYAKAIALLRTSLKYHPNESVLLERLGTLLISCPEPKLQNVREGLELSERAFYHISSNMTTLLSAGKNFALGNAMIGDFETASYYMRVTLNIAKNEKVSKDYMDVLLTLQNEINKAGGIK